MCRALTSRVAYRWRFVSFRGLQGRESAGIVDLVAIRRDTSQTTREGLKHGDLFEMLLVQMKGGSAPKPCSEDVVRLRLVQEHYGARYVVLYEWKRGEFSRFSPLVGSEWIPASAEEIFG